MSAAHAVLEKFPPLGKPKSPGLAALIGALTGGIGLAIYFGSLRDLFPVDVTGCLVAIGSLAAGVDPLQVVEIVAPVVGGVYGFWRAQSSNRRLAAPILPAVAVGSVG
jgi:hypothetical protein